MFKAKIPCPRALVKFKAIREKTVSVRTTINPRHSECLLDKTFTRSVNNRHERMFREESPTSG